jgi:phosphoribosylformimino-5-aminoimidazole carboxamide ribotide isomerase
MEIVKELKPKEVYVADLNAIEKNGNNFEIIKELSANIPVMADCGVRDEKDLQNIRKLRCTPVIGTETAEKRIFEISTGCVASIDIKDDKVLGGWKSVEEAVKFLNESLVKEIIILDISRVGTGRGWRKNEIERIVRLSEKPVIIGGGIKANDLEMMEDCGVSGVLVSTSVHLGELKL